MKILKCPFNWVINPNHSVSQTECSVTMCTCYLAVLYLHDWQRRWLTVVCNKCEDFIQSIFFFKDMIHMGGDNIRNRGKIPPTKISRQKEISTRWSKSCFVKMPRKRKSHSEITKIKLPLVCVNFKLAWLNLVMLEEICKNLFCNEDLNVILSSIILKMEAQRHLKIGGVRKNASNKSVVSSNVILKPLKCNLWGLISRPIVTLKCNVNKISSHTLLIQISNSVNIGRSKQQFLSNWETGISPFALNWFLKIPDQHWFLKIPDQQDTTWMNHYRLFWRQCHNGKIATGTLWAD